MVNVCIFCNHAKYGKEYAYCEVLEKQGKANCLEDSFHGIDRSEECNGSFAWNCDIEQIIRTLKLLSDWYLKLDNAEFKLKIVKQEKVKLTKS